MPMTGRSYNLKNGKFSSHKNELIQRTALHWAAGNNNTDALRVLIQMGASVDAKVCL